MQGAVVSVMKDQPVHRPMGRDDAGRADKRVWHAMEHLHMQKMLSSGAGRGKRQRLLPESEPLPMEKEVYKLRERGI